jgi:aldehyde dehydrogenase (NAD(P)+)
VWAPLGRGAHTRADGRVEIDVFPTDAMDAALFAGFRAKVLMLPGIDEAKARQIQASFYQGKAPAAGKVALVLGAGNVASIPPLDVAYKMFVDGEAAILKMNPVNEYLGPFFERALAPLIRRGYLEIVYGGGDVGKQLVEHPSITSVHITGSDKTHDTIVWGPPGPERERRKQAKDPLLKKTITSELGNVSPVAIVPADYSDAQLWFMARNVVSMVGNNGSFNCNAAKMLVTSAGWPQATKFRTLVRKALSELPMRKAYYPGAKQRYSQLLDGRTGVEKFGSPGEDALAWAYVSGLDPSNPKEDLFEVEPFCGILSETSLPATDPVDFLAAATTFCNDRLWGTLNAAILIHPKLESDRTVGAALDRAVLDLRYGTVAINHWPALGYGFASTPWGGHPSSTLENVQSGIGWVHNTFLLEGIEKTVVRGPLVVQPKPAWFYDNKSAHRLGRKLVWFEAAPSWLKVPGMALTAMQG